MDNIMNLTFYFSALFVVSIFIIVTTLKRHKKEQAEINKIILNNKETTDALNNTIDAINKKS